MAPAKKPKISNKRFSSFNDVTPKKESDNSSKSGLRKRRLSDMLGPQWSKKELERFYEAYRKYGKDWKKVAVSVRNRSMEMVEALYTMNKAYLSLPEGTASAVGLVAMMTDHYSNRESSDSEQESNEGVGTSPRPQRRVQANLKNFPAKVSDSLHRDLLLFQSAGSDLSLLRKRRSGNRTRAVGKRTPRFPVSHSKDGSAMFVSPAKQGLKSKIDTSDDEVAHEIALALTEASQRGGSPQVSRTPNQKSGTPTPVRNRQRMNPGIEMKSTKRRRSEMDEGGFELSLGSTEADSGDYVGNKSYLMSREGAGLVEIRHKGKKHYGQTPEVDEGVNNHMDDIKEAFSGTEEGQNLGSVKRKFEAEADAKSSRASYRAAKKKSKKVLFERDESSAFDALQTLADLSLMHTAIDTDSVVPKKDLKSTTTNNSKLKDSHSIPGVKSPKCSTHDDGYLLEGKEESSHIKSGTQKLRQRSSPLKVLEDDTLASACQDSLQKAKDEAKFVSNAKRSHILAHPKHAKFVEAPDRSSSSTDTEPGMDWNDSVRLKVMSPSTGQVNLPIKARTRRKTEAPKRLIDVDVKSPENIIHSHSSVLNLKKNLSHCLSWVMMRRWCYYEWFYSAIDYPWFARREFVEYLDHVGLAHIPRLTRVEWGVIRSSLGKPRRFSEQLLNEEKEKLNQYRESVRKHYSELRNGTREGLPTDLARPLSVGQRVIAIHPKTREINDGSILTVDHSRCRVQFDKPELGVEFVMDINCMPLNLSENFPACLMRQNVGFDKVFEISKELKSNRQLKESRMEENLKLLPCEKLENTNGFSDLPTSTYLDSAFLYPKGGSPASYSQVKVGSCETVIVQQQTNPQTSFSIQVQAKEADVQALSELTSALDKKEAVVAELRRMNDEVLENQKDGGCSVKDTEPFKKQYAAVLLQLNEVNEQVSSALFCLRQRNTYPGNSSSLVSFKPSGSIAEPGNLPASVDRSACHHQESAPHVVEIVESSRTRAQKMVDAAMQAMTYLKKGENSVDRIEEVIDFVNNQLSSDELSIAGVRSSITAVSTHHNLGSQVPQTGWTTAAPLATPTQEPKLEKAALLTDAPVPSELIARCVATLLMIQKCTERQFPPGDVAQVLDYAMTSLHPGSSANLPIYGEIQKCVGIIRNQILALVPT